MSKRVANIIKLAIGISATVAVEILAKGNWAHAVWVPVALMFATDFQKVFGSSEVGQILSSQRVRFLLGAGAAVGVELLAKGPWAHAVWVPVAAMLFTNIEQVFAPAMTAAAAPPEATASSEAITPNEKPPAK